MLIEAVEKRATSNRVEENSTWQELLRSAQGKITVADAKGHADPQPSSPKPATDAGTNNLPVRSKEDVGHTTRILGPHANAAARELVLRALFVAGLSIAVLQAGILWFAPRPQPVVFFTNLPAELLEVRK